MTHAQIVHENAAETNCPSASWQWLLRPLLGISLAALLTFLTFFAWVFGTLVFAFSLDGASTDVRSWVEPMMLKGWPTMLGVTAIVPSMMYAFGVKLNKCVVTQIITLVVSCVWYVFGLVATGSLL